MTVFEPFSWTVTQRQIDAYAEAAGADDPIHVDPVSRAGEGGTIAQGMLVMAVMAEYLARALPDAGAWRAGGCLDLRFKAPARPGDRLTFRVRPEPEATEGDCGASYAVSCSNDAGIVILQGTASVPAAALSG
jgi:acyl dehydratase